MTTLKQKLKTFSLIILIPALFFSSTPCTANQRSKANCLMFLKVSQKENREAITLLESRIRSLLGSGTQLNFDAPVGGSPLLMNSIIKKRKEHLLRQDFLDRLVFQIQSSYESNKLSLNEFLKKKFMKMSLAEALSKKSSTQMWKFLNYLSIAIGTVTEGEEDLMEFVISYMKTSSISSPIQPQQYMEFRAYTNGSENMAAKDISREEAGQVPENVLKEKNQKTKPTAPFRNRSTKRPPAKTAISSIGASYVNEDTNYSF